MTSSTHRLKTKRLVMNAISAVIFKVRATASLKNLGSPASSIRKSRAMPTPKNQKTVSVASAGFHRSMYVPTTQRVPTVARKSRIIPAICGSVSDLATSPNPRRESDRQSTKAARTHSQSRIAS